MENIGGGIWSITKELSPGTYTYKFKNGFYDNWDEGWESWDKIGKGGCGYGKDNNRKFRVQDKNLTLEYFVGQTVQIVLVMRYQMHIIKKTIS